jgi:pimeloyl-ACP methyl ester carboxylesterase
VTPHLDEAGVAWRALDLSMRSLAGDAAEVTSLLDDIGGPVVLTGHSYGGAVLTAAGTHPSVEHLVFLCALTPGEGESCVNCYADSGAPGTELGDAFDIDGAGDITLQAGAVGLLYNLCSDADAQAAYRRLRPIARECFTASPAVVAWEKVPSTYVVCESDLGIHPELQHALATRCGGAEVVWDLDHSPFYSDPARTAALLVAVARDGQ